MKVLGKSSLSAKLKLLLDGAWYLGILGIVITLPLTLWVLSTSSNCTDSTVCSSSATIDGIGFSMDTTTPLKAADGGVAYFSEGYGQLVIKGTQLNPTIIITMLVEAVTLGLLFLFTVWLLRKLFKTFVEGAPFALANIRTLRWIAVSICAIAVSNCFFSTLNTWLLSKQFSGEGIHLVSKGNLSIASLFAAVIIFIFAEIFRLGAQLEEEKAHTV